METVIKKLTFLNLSNRNIEILIDVITYLFVLLFVYTAASKLLTISTFIDVLGKYPVIGKYNTFVGYAVPGIELVISAALIIPFTKRIGLFMSLIIMLLFLLYIIYMIISGSELPCSCGGIISKLSWQQHLWFNSVFIVLAGIGIKLSNT